MLCAFTAHMQLPVNAMAQFCVNPANEGQTVPTPDQGPAALPQDRKSCRLQLLLGHTKLESTVRCLALRSRRHIVAFRDKNGSWAVIAGDSAQWYSNRCRVRF